MPLPPQPPDECAQCGAAIPARAKACPECGADERTGWRQADPYDGLNLPGEAFEDESRDKNQDTAPAARVNGVPWYWWTVGVILLILLATSFLGLA